ncbi:PREDICTED: AT-hook motif nuclear-localized protein 13-like isoform X2 [Camelina sativa]|nr:PREDICTED: AT-hook motif nuclear-localized protein 13-like isoform X2 [Camelina sativa]
MTSMMKTSRLIFRLGQLTCYVGLGYRVIMTYGGGNEGAAGGDSGGANANSSDPPAKRNRGRPPGSGKKQLDALGGTGGVGFTPHVIEVKTGEGIAMKVMAFTGPRTICILSATGSVFYV